MEEGTVYREKQKTKLAHHMRQIRLLIAEMLLNWTLSIMPKGREQMLLATFLKDYGKLMAQEYVQELKKQRKAVSENHSSTK